MLQASIDIGSNSILLLIIDKKDDDTFSEIVNESRVTGLGKDLDKTGVFAVESMEDSEKALCEYSEILKKHNVDSRNIYITATEAARIAANAGDFFSKIEKKLSLSITIITGEGEAYYTTLGVLKGLEKNNNDVVIMDIGGASTELIAVTNNQDDFAIHYSVSLPMGSVRATDWGLDSDRKLNEKLSETIALNEKWEVYQTSRLVCVAGTMTSVGAMIKGMNDYQAEKIHLLEFSTEKLYNLIDSMKKEGVAKTSERYPFLKKRASTILGGAIIAKRIAEKLGVKEFVISTYGLRYGVVLNGGIDGKYIRTI